MSQRGFAQRDGRTLVYGGTLLSCCPFDQSESPAHSEKGTTGDQQLEDMAPKWQDRNQLSTSVRLASSRSRHDTDAGCSAVVRQVNAKLQAGLLHKASRLSVVLA